MSYTKGVSVYILNDKNQVLMLMHKKINRWMPPGGGVEGDELIHQAAIREVNEETGLEIDFIYDYIDENHQVDERARLLPFPMLIQLEKGVNEDFIYLARAKNDKIDNKENHIIKWFNIDEAIELDIFTNVKRDLEYIKRKMNL